MALEGKDVMVKPQTCTGKTAAALACQPLIRTEATIRKRSHRSQLNSLFKVERTLPHGRSKGERVAQFTVSFSVEKQISLSGAHIVVGTPGRLLDLIKRKALVLILKPSSLSDEMLNMELS